MGEIDTKPIESVQLALSFFGEKNDQKKYRSTGNEGKQELEEKELDFILKELSNYKVQLEVKESSYMQALLELDLSKKTVEKLSAQLNIYEAEREKSMKEAQEAKTQIDELNTNITEIVDQLIETDEAQEQLLHTINELEVTQKELIDVRAELAASEELKHVFMTQEEDKTKELLKHISELDKVVLVSKLASIDIEKERSEEMKKQMDMMQNELMAKNLNIDLLQMALEQLKENYSSSAESPIDSVNDLLNGLKAELEMMEKTNEDQTVYVESMEKDHEQLQLELKSAKQEVEYLNHEVKMLSSEIHNATIEMDELRGRERETQVEIAMLKSEMHKGRSKIAALEAAEVAARSVKSGFYLAVQHIAIEAQEAKKEILRLKEEAKQADITEIFKQYLKHPQAEELKSQTEEITLETNSLVAVSSKEEDDLLTEVASKGDENAGSHSGNGLELDTMNKELEVAKAEIKKLRLVADEAVSRADAAEQAKTAIEDQLRKYREHKYKQRAALAALKEESTRKQSNPSKPDNLPKVYTPLGKVLNMKF
ncbi:hypothetical protein GIB67_007277 [Kingdonia uniflora]|uniref:Uncharacterized protein n=1 Tax=Kingdonia uniflora TaxID=39325 RepID=A0A7J7NX27_9MAGN|nr:hypothetical protein GIB67_007277 [Kingdonia uniflora]